MIDSHVHFWQLKRGGYSWISEARPVLCRNFLPNEFAQIISVSQVSKCIAVQAAPTVAETMFQLELAETHSCIAAVTGWVDLTGATVENELRQLKSRPNLKAIRPMAGMSLGEKWLNTESYRSGFAALSRQGLILETLALPVHLNAIAALAQIHPDLTIVVNHAAKPTPEDLPQWTVDIQKFSRLNNVYCKVSGFTQQSMDYSHQARVFEQLVVTFGAQRLMWGSDFPVVLETSGYSQWLAQSSRLFSGLSATEKKQISNDTAMRLYQL